MNSYTMYPEKHIAIVRFNPGVLELADTIAINEAYKHDARYSHIHFLVIILTGCIPNFTEKDLPTISELYNSNVQVNNHKTSVWLVDEPLLTAFAHIFVDNTDEKSYYCSTVEKAYSLLKPDDISYTEFIQLLEEGE